MRQVSAESRLIGAAPPDGVRLDGAPPGRAPASVAPDLFRSVLRHQANGVAVVTAGPQRPAGFCATSVVSVSLDPPLLSFAIGLTSSSWETVREATHLMVHLLGDDQQAIAQRFAQTGAQRFGAQTRWHRGPYRLPQLDDVLGWLALETVHRLPVGDHALVVGRVIAAGHDPGRAPLVYHDGAYVRLASSPS
jgi:flavin reductase (DIM6/NTAB) family NADH-FMN oxidoreductase RutF